MTKKIMYDYLVYIGRFQIFHNGHKHSLQEALKKAKKIIIVLGSHQLSPSIKNPWSTRERIFFIQSCFSKEDRKRLEFVLVHDRLYDEESWRTDVLEGVQAIVRKDNFSTVTRPEALRIRDKSKVVLKNTLLEKEIRQDLEKKEIQNSSVGLIGYVKDASSYYLKFFPEWSFFDTGFYEGINASDLRSLYFSEGIKPLLPLVPKEMASFLKKFSLSLCYKKLQKECLIEKKERNYFSVAIIWKRKILVSSSSPFQKLIKKPISLPSFLSKEELEFFFKSWIQFFKKKIYVFDSPFGPISTHIYYLSEARQDFFSQEGFEEREELFSFYRWMGYEEFVKEEQDVILNHFQIVEDMIFNGLYLS